jgi:hypothetical protein
VATAPVGSLTVNADEVGQWFGAYLVTVLNSTTALYRGSFLR